MNQCFQKFVIQKCNCTFAFLPSVYEKPSCLGEQFFCAVQFNFNEFQSENFIENNCFPQCPLECKSLTYTATTSHGDYPTEALSKKYLQYQQIQKLYLNKTFSSSLSSNLVSLSVFYEKLAYTTIEESPNLDLVTLLSNLGGIAGLFLGISALSLVELFEILFEMVYVFCNFQNDFSSSKVKYVRKINVKSIVNY